MGDEMWRVSVGYFQLIWCKRSASRTATLVSWTLTASLWLCRYRFLEAGLTIRLWTWTGSCGALVDIMRQPSASLMLNTCARTTPRYPSPIALPNDEYSRQSFNFLQVDASLLSESPQDGSHPTRLSGSCTLSPRSRHRPYSHPQAEWKFSPVRTVGHCECFRDSKTLPPRSFFAACWMTVAGSSIR
jgi:hypothetical protein